MLSILARSYSAVLPSITVTKLETMTVLHALHFDTSVAQHQHRQLVDFKASSTSAQSYRIMDTLASSHTAHSCAARRLLVMIFALVLFRYSIMAVAGASASGIVQDTGSVSRDSLVPGAQAGPNDLLQRSGSVPATLDKSSPSAVGMSDVEGSRRLLGDISPPGMWPAPDGQDPAPAQEEFRRRSLLTGGMSPPPMTPWFDVMHSSQDGEDAFLRQGLVADTTYPLVPWALMINKLRELSTALNMSSLSFRIRLPRYLRMRNTVAPAEDSFERIQHGNQQVVVPDGNVSSDTVDNEMQSGTEHFGNLDGLQQSNLAEDLKFPKKSLLQGDISPPGLWPDDDDDKNEVSEFVQRKNLAGDFRIPRRSLLQGDISPPGMWSDSDDEERQLSESALLRGRNLLNKFTRRSLLQGDISPPGMWPDSDDDESQLSESGLMRRRSLLNKFPRRSLLQGDISPPGLLPDNDDDKNEVSEFVQRRNLAGDFRVQRRSLLQGDISPPGMWSDSDDDERQLSASALLRGRNLLNKFTRRSLLQGDISPPGMWPDSDDDESQLSESGLMRRRSLLNKFSRRSLLQGDISPPGMWPDSDDDESQLSESGLLRRRSLLNSFPKRSLLQGDISPPGMWPDSDDDENQLSESGLLRTRRLMNM